MVQTFICKENGVFDEDRARSQDEGEEQVDVNVVPGAAKLPAGGRYSEFSAPAFPRRQRRLQPDPGGGACRATSHQSPRKRPYLKTVKTKMATMREMSEVA